MIPHPIFGGHYYDSVHTGGTAMTTATLDRLAATGLNAYPDGHRGFYRVARNLGAVLVEGPGDGIDPATAHEPHPDDAGEEPERWDGQG